MFQPRVIQSLTESQQFGNNCNENYQNNGTQQRAQSDNPFNFTPQRILLHKDHQLLEDGDIHRHMYLQDLFISDAEDKSKLSVSEFTCHISGCSHLSSTVEDYEHHYNSLHRHVCCTCNCSLPSSYLLDLHIQEWHDSLFTVLAQRQDMYQCLIEGCGVMSRTSQQRRDHVVRIHSYPPDFRFDQAKSTNRAQEMKSRQKKDGEMDVVDDVSESQDVCS
ncbi:zinc finger protein 511 [Genypterus blacodes]|uniref:zinc finger protein 511 n=1 Tax=Genypterus blacodes TaxID=154954 RepID=UPI003F75C002